MNQALQCRNFKKSARHNRPSFDLNQIAQIDEGLFAWLGLAWLGLAWLDESKMFET
jgi:hypothetical protein